MSNKKGLEEERVYIDNNLERGEKRRAWRR